MKAILVTNKIVAGRAGYGLGLHSIVAKRSFNRPIAKCDASHRQQGSNGYTLIQFRKNHLTTPRARNRKLLLIAIDRPGGEMPDCDDYTAESYFAAPTDDLPYLDYSSNQTQNRYANRHTSAARLRAIIWLTVGKGRWQVKNGRYRLRR